MQIISQQNDTVDLICWRYLGQTAGVTEQVLTDNPQIQSLTPILPAGLTLLLPEKNNLVDKTDHTQINLWD